MADHRDAYRRARERELDLRALRDALAAANDELARAQRERASAGRTTDARLPHGRDDVVDRQVAVDEAAALVAGLRERIRRGQDELAKAVSELAAVSDPTEAITQLDAGAPLLLMPLRIEIRFKGAELWVRIYPDQWAIDGFEERLTAGEVANATRFWASMYRAGGDDGMRRSAWRALVAATGSGRAGWIIDQFRPLNPEDEPRRASGDEVILVVAGDLALDAAQTREAATYWEAVWRAGGDPDGQFAEALEDVLGEEAARQITARPPHTLTERPAGLDPTTATVTVAYCRLPAVDSGDVGSSSWTKASRANVLPDRIVLVGLDNGTQVLEFVGEPIPPSLAVGPDPSAGPNEQFRMENGELVVPDELRWMVDFEAAVKVGMAMQVPLPPALRGGFDRLFAVGIRAGATAAGDQADLETLLTHHHRSRAGLSLVAQGTPTNNTEGVPSGLDRLDDPDLSYDRYLGAGVGGLVDEPSWAAKQDGQWLAECLGIDPGVFAAVAGATGTDQAEARAMNTALWPATWGYFLESMLHPLLSDRTVQLVRAFFVDYVSGRGRVPALRIGRQPYGVLPVTALAKLRFGAEDRLERPDAGDDPQLVLLSRLNRLLSTMTADFAPLAAAVPHAFGGGDAHQTLLDVVAFHPASVEFHQRYAESIVDVFNRFRFDDLGDEFFTVWEALGSTIAGRRLLARLGDTSADLPDIVDKLFHSAQHRLKGPVIDDRPLSEEAPVRAYCDDGRNYLRWLADAASTSLEALRREEGFRGDREPTALLYVLLRHALLLAWFDAAVRLRLDAGLLDEPKLKAARREPQFIHVTGEGPTESRWFALYDSAEQITGDQHLSLHEVIPQLLDKDAVRHLADALRGVRAVADLPTARLERLLAEHLDCCSHRLDAWRLALVTHRLLDLRDVHPSAGTGGPAANPRRGVHLGAYGWLEDVRPKARDFEKVELPPGLEPVFGKDEPLPVRDPSNGGFVHAPSLNHAATAAILRSGFLANATPAHPDTMALNISSERMRLARSVLEGLRNGQPLGALLGYRFERGLHDRHGLAEVDSCIHELRLAFPAPGDPDVRVVVDGLSLVRQILETNNPHYPFDRPDLPAVTSAQRQAIDLEAERLLDVHDAVADLMLAEGVHQAVLGNFEGVASTVDAVGRGGVPPEPAVLDTPETGITLTHRFAVHLRTGLDHHASPVDGVAMTPRAMAEPGVNELLAALLPQPADVVARVRWTEPDGTERDRLVSQKQLVLQPIDLLYLLRLEAEAALGELDERILRRVTVDEGLRPDVTPTVRFTEQVSGSHTFFELAPLVGHLRALVTGSRPLQPTDAVWAQEADAADDGGVHADRRRPADVVASLEAHRTDLDDLAAEIEALLADPDANRSMLVAGIDGFIDRAADLLERSGAFGLTGSSWAPLAERRTSLFNDLLGAVAALNARWRPRLERADASLARDSALPVGATDQERVALLLLADRELRPVPTSPVPTDASAYRTAIDTQRADFAARLAGFEAVDAASSTAADALAATGVLLPVATFDGEPFDIGPFEERAVDLCRQVADTVRAMVTQVDTRLAAAVGHMATHDAAQPGRLQVDALAATVAAVLGPDSVYVPEFDVPVAAGEEWEAAMGWVRSGGLLAGLAMRPFPVDDWLHGVARVRDKVRSWEQVALLAPAVGRAEPQLWPVQVPHASEPWLAMEWPSTFTLTGERLLYTAHYPAAFDKSAAQAGLLVDEWVELVPGDIATTGIVFHHDSPDSEPPQTMLLVVPPDPSAGWRWDDLVAALGDTLDLARLRAVEPDAVARSPYASFLPAAVSEATVRGLGISANYAVNNELYRALRVDRA